MHISNPHVHLTFLSLIRHGEDVFELVIKRRGYEYSIWDSSYNSVNQVVNSLREDTAIGNIHLRDEPH